jgi:hypothetical protein
MKIFSDRFHKRQKNIIINLIIIFNIVISTRKKLYNVYYCKNMFSIGQKN